MICMNDFIVNNIVLIVKQDMIREVISDIVPDMVRSIVQEEMTSVREEVTIVREAITSLRNEVRSELQSFYERISTLIKRSFAHPAPASGPPPPPLPSHSRGTQAEKEADAAITGPSDDTAHAATDTSTPTADPSIDMVYFF